MVVHASLGGAEEHVLEQASHNVEPGILQQSCHGETDSLSGRERSDVMELQEIRWCQAQNSGGREKPSATMLSSLGRCCISQVNSEI